MERATQCLTPLLTLYVLLEMSSKQINLLLEGGFYRYLATVCLHEVFNRVKILDLVYCFSHALFLLVFDIVKTFHYFGNG